MILCFQRNTSKKNHLFRLIAYEPKEHHSDMLLPAGTAPEAQSLQEEEKIVLPGPRGSGLAGGGKNCVTRTNCQWLLIFNY